jgi:hypothetical protein
MSTRGFLGFVVDGTEKIAYNHYDSYPGGLGVNVLEWLRAADLDAARAAAADLRVVDGDSEPTDEDIARYAHLADLSVDRGPGRPSWYQLIHDAQGDPAVVLATGVVEDAGRFPLDSLWAEWGYLIDFDAGTFEVYEGYQERAHSDGRFAGRERTNPEFAPVRLVFSRPLHEPPSEDEFAAAFGFESAADDDFAGDLVDEALRDLADDELRTATAGGTADAVERIDEVLHDYAVSDDAMRWRPVGA